MGNAAGNDLDQQRLKYTFMIVMTSLGLVTAIVLAIALGPGAADSSAIITAALGVIGTIVGSFTGLQLGTAGREKADAARIRAERLALRFEQALPPEQARKIRQESA